MLNPYDTEEESTGNTVSKRERNKRRSRYGIQTSNAPPPPNVVESESIDHNNQLIKGMRLFSVVRKTIILMKLELKCVISNNRYSRTNLHLLFHSFCNYYAFLTSERGKRGWAT